MVILSLNAEARDGTAVTSDKQIFLGAVLNALIVGNNNNTRSAAIGLGATQPTPDQKRQIKELSANAKEAQQCFSRISFKKVYNKAMVVTNEDYKTLQEIMPKLRDYFINTEEKLRVVN